MIRLATVFSGIGAIEHALERMGVEHEIVFACDNGDVEILTKDIGLNLDEINSELIKLEQIIGTIKFSDEVEDIYKNQLSDMLMEALEENEQLHISIDAMKLCEDQMLKSALETIIDMKSVKASRIREYKKFLSDIGQGSVVQSKLRKLQIMLEIANDYKKDNAIENIGKDNNYKSTDGIEWKLVDDIVKILYENIESVNGKKIIRRAQDLSQRTSQLHEKINYMQIQKHLESMEDDWTSRKKYVDSLYVGKEKSNKVKQSYMANYKLAEEHFHWNVAFLNGRQYSGQVDLFVGGSPCQSFSLVGKQRGLEDTRGTLFYEYARLIKEIQPKVFIYENVKAILSNDEGKTWKKMIEVFRELGYKLHYTANGKHSVLNAKDYGIPQNRERMFVIGFRQDLEFEKEFEFPAPVKLEKTMKDFLLDNVSGRYYLPAKGVDFVTNEKNLSKKFTQINGDIALCQKKNQQFNWHGDFVFEEENVDKEKTMEELEKYFLSEKVKKYVLSSGTKNFYSRPETDLDIARPLLTTMHKMHRAGVDNYVTTSGRLRKLTPRECLRLMGFCDSFKIVVSDTAMYQQAGNSIVVDVLIAILTEIFKSYQCLLQEGA